ncbi:MAG: hypothetical protein AUH44_00510 [Chloroflexi bacterium 13_1_40CM_68_15]|nr:MAG: hypothetical protein AUH44_00510 [Chloroflexi bacterium 13_1_40CM_68_15]
MNSRERVTRALSGHNVDRVPFAVWRHFYPDENEGAAKLAETTIAFTKRHQLDLIKFNPRAHYHAEPWGTRYRYGRDGRPGLERYAVTKPEHWARIRRKTMREPAFRELLYGLRLVREVLPETPLLATIFTPLGVLERLAGTERVLADLHARTDEVASALDAVAGTFAELAAACCEIADGIFLARVLAGARGAALNVLHVCGPDARVVELARYPVAAVSWNPRLPGNPDLAAFLAAVPARGAIGGFSDEAFLARSPVVAKREAGQGLLQTGGKRWLAAGGCTIPVESRPEAIDAAREALRGPLPPHG